MFVHVCSRLFTFVHILPSFIEPTALTHNFHQNPSVTFTFLFKVVSLSSHLWNFFFEWKDEGLTLETSALENSSTQLRKPHGLLIKPHYCVIHSNTVSLEIYRLCSIWYWSHRGCKRELLRCMFYILLDTKEFDIYYKFSVCIGQPFAIGTEVEFSFSNKRREETTWWNFA